MEIRLVLSSCSEICFSSFSNATPDVCLLYDKRFMGVVVHFILGPKVDKQSGCMRNSLKVVRIRTA